MTTQETLQQAINKILLRYPFFSLLLLKHKIIYDNSGDNKTAYTDGVTLGINETYFNVTLNLAQRLCLLAHEVAHIMLKHHLRRGARDHQRWNKAADYAINLMLVKWGFTPLPNWLYD